MPHPPLSISDKAVKYKYTKLSDLRPGQDINVYGYIVRYSGPFKTRGSDWCMSLTIIDDTSPPPNEGNTASAIPIQIFHPDPARFPKITKVGDIIQLRHIKVQRYKDTYQGLSMKYTAFTVFSRDSSGIWSSEPSHALTPEEHLIVETVYRGSTHLDPDSAAKKTTPYMVYDSQDPINKIKSLSDLQVGIFADLICEVYKVLLTNPGRTNLLVTDYTENENVAWDIENERLQYMRKRLILVTFWDKYASYPATLKEGDVVMLKGIKISKYDTKLAASMHSHEPGTAEERILVLQKDSPEAASVFRRKANLEKLSRTAQEMGNIELTICQNAKKIPKRTLASMRAAAMDGSFPFGLVNARVVKVNQKSPVYKELYVLEMVLKDDSDEVTVIVYDKDGEDFFGCKAEDFGGEQQKKFERLQNSLLSNPFLLKAYKTRGQIVYKLFNTTLTG